MQDTKNSLSAHHHTTMSGHIFATKAHIDNRKKNLLNSNISSTRPHNMLNIGPLMAEICWQVWGNPANLNVFRVLAASRRQPNCGVEQRAPPIFGKAANTLGIGPHSSLTYLLTCRVTVGDIVSPSVTALSESLQLAFGTVCHLTSLRRHRCLSSSDG